VPINQEAYYIEENVLINTHLEPLFTRL